MKDRKIYRLFLAVALLLMVSCNEYHAKIHTTIHEDGTCARTVEINKVRHQQEMEEDSLCEDSDKEDVYIPEWFDQFECHIDSATMVFDDTWQKTWSVADDTAQYAFPIKQGIKEKDLIVTAHQNFGSVDEMCKKTPFRYNNRMYDVKGEFKKIFRWFYTEYTYTETYQNVSDMFVKPLGNYMEEDVASYWLTGTPHLTEGLTGAEAKDKLDGVESHYEKWLNENLLEDLCNLIEQHYDEIVDAPISKEEFHAKREALLNYVDENGFYLEEENGLEELFFGFFNTKVYSDLVADGTQHGKELEKIFNDKYLDLWAYPQKGADYELDMPGEIINAGSGKIENGKAVYQLSVRNFLQKDYTISATSRKTNYWAYIILFIVLAVAIGSFIYKKRK
ncbi:MAG: hypothetical protein GXY64_06095 [Bacteroidales bacterium]|nr:hypothetical protein [Bacteroidales bacterium]